MSRELKEPTLKHLWEGWYKPTEPSGALQIGLRYARMEGLWCSGALFDSRISDEHRHYHGKFVRHSSNPEDWKKGMPDRDRRCYCERCIEIRIKRDKVLSEGYGCGDIKACSTGILIMAVLDGPAINAYFNSTNKALVKKLLPGIKNHGFDVVTYIEDLLVKDSVGRAACIFLHAGMNKLKLERFDPAKTADAEEKGFAVESIDDPTELIERYIAGPQPGPRGGTSRLPSVDSFRLQMANESKTTIVMVNDSDHNPNLDLGIVEPVDESAFRIPPVDDETYHDVIVKCFEYGLELAQKCEGRLGFFDADAEPTKV